MKQILSILLILMIFTLFIPVGHAQYYQNHITLKIGMGGTDVRDLQNDLKNLGYFTSKSTGYFGTVTQSAVMHFQRENYLTPDGIVGHYTATVIKRERIVQTAKWYVGKPYLLGGTTPSGFDCSGFTQYVMKLNNLPLTRTTATQYTEGIWVARDKLKKGDFVFFNTSGQGVSHVGIYIGGGAFISAQSGAGQVKIALLSNSYWNTRYMSSRRMVY